jgi:hypothetical protein
LTKSKLRSILARVTQAFVKLSFSFLVRRHPLKYVGHFQDIM